MHSQAERSFNEKEDIMLHSIQQRYGEKLRATDGEIGHVRDFYFDDKTWTIRYLVADTGGWLTDRQVLISPHALGHLYPQGKVFLVKLRCACDRMLGTDRPLKILTRLPVSVCAQIAAA